MDLLRLDPEVPVSVTTDGTRLLIEPVRETGNDARSIQADVIAIEAFPNEAPVIRWIENVE
jgi:virulence-associated protein VagC